MRIHLTESQMNALAKILDKLNIKYKLETDAAFCSVELSAVNIIKIKKQKLPQLLSRVFKEIHKKSIEKSDLKKWIKATSRILKHSETRKHHSPEYLDGGYNMLKILSKKYQLGS